MFSIFSNLVLFMTSCGLLHPAERDPTQVPFLEHLVLGILVTCGTLLFRQRLNLHRTLVG